VQFRQQIKQRYLHEVRYLKRFEYELFFNKQNALPTNDLDFFEASNQLISTTGIPRDTAHKSFTVRRT
jgi:hypothetical protein